MLHPLGKVWRRHTMPFATEITTHGVRFRLWAPKRARIELNIVGGVRRLMRPVGDGWHELLTSAAPGTVVIAASTRRLTGGLFDFTRTSGRSRSRALPHRSRPRGYCARGEPLRGAVAPTA